MQRHDKGDGATCWTGQKVYCCDLTALTTSVAAIEEQLKATLNTVGR